MRAHFFLPFLYIYIFFFVYVCSLMALFCCPSLLQSSQCDRGAIFCIYWQKLLLLIVGLKWRTNSFNRKREGILSKFNQRLPQAHCNVNNSAKAFPYPPPPFLFFFCFVTGLLLQVALDPSVRLLVSFFFFFFVRPAHVRGASDSQLYAMRKMCVHVYKHMRMWHDLRVIASFCISAFWSIYGTL